MLEDQADILYKQRFQSVRDAATLTEDNRGLHKDLLTEVKTLSPEEEEEDYLSLVLRQHDRLRMPVAKEPEDEDLELVEGRRSRHTRPEASYEKRQSNKTDGRYCVYVYGHV